MSILSLGEHSQIERQQAKEVSGVAYGVIASTLAIRWNLLLSLGQNDDVHTFFLIWGSTASVEQNYPSEVPITWIIAHVGLTYDALCMCACYDSSEGVSFPMRASDICMCYLFVESHSMTFLMVEV